ncbi:unnamed protein product [Priceomyces carsonii]|nr:unnamed protein product [Priceomyces carsonii]
MESIDENFTFWDKIVSLWST